MAPNTCSRIMRFRRPSGETIERPLRTAASKVVLVTQRGDEEYKLGYKEVSEGERVVFLGSAGNDVMTRDPDVGMAFTRMMLRLYAFGELEPCLESAELAYAEFRHITTARGTVSSQSRICWTLEHVLGRP